MKPRKNKPKTVNVALPEYLHEKVLSFADLFALSVGTMTEIIVKNGLKNIVSVQVKKLENKIELLKNFNME